MHQVITALAIPMLLGACSLRFETAPAGPSPLPSVRPAPDPVEVVIEDVQAFWEREFPDLYDSPYQRLESEDIHAAGRPGVQVPSCQGRTITEAAWHDNAFYCYRDGYVAYDARPDGLVSRIRDEFGLPAVGAVFAHEFGHAVQDQAGNIRVPAIYAELQADCLAGAWVAHVRAGEATGAILRPGDLDQVLSAVLSFRDAPGSRAAAADAHGSGFDRVSAFQDGYNEGTRGCADYFDDPPFITEVPFGGSRDVASGGNAPAAKVLPASVELLNDFYSRVEHRSYRPVDPKDVFAFDPQEPPDSFPECGATTLTAEQLTGTVFFCHPERFVVVDVAHLRRVYEDIGDFGVTTLLAVPWAVYVQDLKGIDGAGATDPSARAADCYTGGFAFGMVTGKLRSETLRGPVSLSAGDLDEAISAFLDADQLAGGEGDAVFERVDAFRDGFFEGYVSCDGAWGLG